MHFFENEHALPNAMGFDTPPISDREQYKCQGFKRSSNKCKPIGFQQSI
jgi:hypothetical protein